MLGRQGSFLQIANPLFLVAWNGIKIRFSNTILYVDLRKLFRNRGQYYSTELELHTMYVKYCLVLVQLTKKFNSISGQIS